MTNTRSNFILVCIPPEHSLPAPGTHSSLTKAMYSAFKTKGWALAPQPKNICDDKKNFAPLRRQPTMAMAADPPAA